MNSLNKHKHIFTSVQPIRWGDMDALGHVNNTIYFRYMEQTRVEWMEQHQLYLTPAKEEGVVIINASCTFLAQLTYPGKVEIKMFVGEIGRSSFQTYYTVHKVGEDICYAEGASKVVWIHYANSKSAPLPDYLKKLIS